MIEKSTMDFLIELRSNNNREWFTANKERFEKAKMNVEDFILFLIAGISLFDRQVQELDPNRCLFRIYRDVRFSKDKTPYKTAFGINLMKKTGAQFDTGYYLHLDPEKTLLYCGCHLPDPTVLNRLRVKIDTEFKEFDKLLKDPGISKHFRLYEGEKLKNVPRGFDPESPAAGFLKYKEFMLESAFSSSEAISASFGDEVIHRLKTAKKFNDFLRIQ